MADARLRALERQFADEGDLDAGRELVASRRRAGESVCGPLLAADIRPANRFASDLPLAVHVLDEANESKWVGNTPSKTPLEVPAHRAWWIQPLRTEAEHLERAIEVVREHTIPGIAIAGRSANGAIPTLPSHLELLRIQRRATPRGGLELADPDPALAVPNLTRLMLEGATGLELDPGDLLTEASLSGESQACREVLIRFTGRELPLTRLDVRTFRELDLGQAWEGLPELRDLRVRAGMVACPEDVALTRLERLDLDVMLAENLDSVLRNAAGTLRELRFTGALNALDLLAPLSKLRTLVLGSSARLVPSVFAEHPWWPRLERLGFSANAQAAWAGAVQRLQDLRELRLDRADRWSTEAYRALHALPQLRTLSVRAEPGSGSAWLPLLAGLPLHAFRYQGGIESDFEVLPELPQLRRLNLEAQGEGWTAEQLVRVLEHGQLEELELGGGLVPASVLEARPDLQRGLRVLRAHGEQVTDTTLAALGRLPQLREVDLLGVEPEDVSQAGWKRLLEAPVERLRLGVEPPSTSWRQSLRFTLHALRANLDLGW